MTTASPGGLRTVAFQFFPSPSSGGAEQVVEALAGHGLLAAVSPALVSDPPMREAYLLADADGRLLRDAGAGPEPGFEPAELLEPLAVATDGTVGVEGRDLVFCPPGWQPAPDVLGDQPRFGDVLRARSPRTGVAPLLEEWARRAGSPLRYRDDDGVLTVRFEQASAALHRLRFTPGQHPVAVLSLIRGVRHLSLLTEGERLPGHVLRPERSMLLTFDADELAGRLSPEVVGEFAEFVQWAYAPQGGPGLRLDELLAEEAFAACDPEQARSALRAADDEQWSAGMLAALGLDPGLADLHERRSPFPATAVQPAPGVLSRLFRRRG